jgi:hypothetical protein
VLSDGQKRGFEEQRAAYRTYVESVLGQTLPISPLESAAGGLLLGNPSWVEKMRRLVKGNRVEQKALRRLEWRPGWEDVRKAVEKVKGESWEQFRDRHGDWGRDLVLYLARRHGGLSLVVLAGHSGASSYGAVSKAVRRMTTRLKEDEQMQKVAEDAAKCLFGQT